MERRPGIARIEPHTTTATENFALIDKSTCPTFNPMRRFPLNLKTWLLPIALITISVPQVQAADQARATQPSAAASPQKSSDASQALREAIGAALAKGASASDRKSPKALDFDRDPGKTQTSLEQFLAANFTDPDSRNIVQQAFGNGKLMNNYDSLLKHYGYSPTNLADVTAAYLIVAWEVVNGRDSSSEPAGQSAVRQQLGPAFERTKALAGLPEDVKQSMADRLMFSTMVAGYSYQRLEKEGKTQELNMLQDKLRQNVLGAGVDLTQLDLTSAGLVKR
ncbi:DUF6683 family protein [Azomonas macrocytogenes]|uniref:Uncharacterized protein n=1 Tax=Azomonas macrocytogenes TaxID=69962 RepID=A0A839T062_AZOMA|nr:DUF6683 family protein [Azomonas macrocytogenes]MBB3102792.1 hypothetical protein [Azomonas macrocytogenes]